MELKFILEAILFSAQKALNPKELRDLLAAAAEHGEEARPFKKTREDDIVAALEQLQREHEAAGRSYRLSQPALETLAIIAYRQPLTRAEIEQVRGVAVDGVMQTLLERGLVEQTGRAEVIGRPMNYGTTALFLEYFGLRSLEELPAADELRRIPVTRPETLVTTEPGLATVAPEQLALSEVEPPVGGPAAPEESDSMETEPDVSASGAAAAEPPPPTDANEHT